MSFEREAKYLTELSLVWSMLDQERQARKDREVMLRSARDCLMYVLAGEYTQSDIDAILPEIIRDITQLLKGRVKE